MSSARRLDVDASLQQYLDAIRRVPLLSREEELSLAERFHARGDTRAAHRLVECNLRFVVKIALEYRHYKVRLADLIQEGNIGLMHAVQKFDPGRGVRLITFAVHWVRAHMRAHIMRTWSLVTIGRSRVERRLFFGLARAQARLAHLAPEAHAVTGNTEAERVAEHLGVPLEAVLEMAARTRPDASLDAPIGDGDATLGDLSPSGDEAADVTLTREQLQAALALDVKDALARVDAREQDIIRRRYLADGQPESLADIATTYGVSRERIRQIELRALEKLRVRLRVIASRLQYPGARNAKRLYDRAKVKGARARRDAFA